MRLQLRAKLPAQGPGLVFVTLPAAFLQTPGATWVALAFFIQRLRATLTSALSLLEVITAYFEDGFALSRVQGRRSRRCA